MAALEDAGSAAPRWARRRPLERPPGRLRLAGGVEQAGVAAPRAAVLRRIGLGVAPVEPAHPPDPQRASVTAERRERPRQESRLTGPALVVVGIRGRRPPAELA